MRRVRAGIRHFRAGILFSVVVIGLLGFGYWLPRLYTQLFILPIEYPRLNPATINVIGIKLTGEKIIVSGGIAKLVQTGESDFASPGQADTIGAQSGIVISMKGLVESLQFKESGVSELLAALAKLDTENYPPEDVVWLLDDILAAINGDEKLRAKLEGHLCTKLDGSPTDEISLSRMRDGIVIRVNVPVRVPTDEGDTTVIGTVMLPFRTRLATQTIRHRLLETYEPDRATIEGVYEEVWEKMARVPEDVASSLNNLTSEAAVRRMAGRVERLLKRVTVLVTEAQITAADLITTPKPGSDKFLFTVDLELSTEGRNRLWQYTYLNPGCQLLFIWKGVAIAAPTVQHEMKYSTARITNIKHERSAQEAVRFLQQRSDDKE